MESLFVLCLKSCLKWGIVSSSIVPQDVNDYLEEYMIATVWKPKHQVFMKEFIKYVENKICNIDNMSPEFWICKLSSQQKVFHNTECDWYTLESCGMFCETCGCYMNRDTIVYSTDGAGNTIMRYIIKSSCVDCS